MKLNKQLQADIYKDVFENWEYYVKKLKSDDASNTYLCITYQLAIHKFTGVMVSIKFITKLLPDFAKYKPSDPSNKIWFTNNTERLNAVGELYKLTKGRK